MNVQETHLNSSAINGDILSSRRIRATSLGIFWNGDRIFVAECHDPVKGVTFYRPLGGGIEFGEHSRDTLVREMREEANLEVKNLRYIATVEQIFTYLGETGHEIVMLYECSFTDQSVYNSDVVECCEADGSAFKAVWKSLGEFGPDAPLYPDGLLELLVTTLNEESK